MQSVCRAAGEGLDAQECNWCAGPYRHAVSPVQTFQRVDGLPPSGLLRRFSQSRMMFDQASRYSSQSLQAIADRLAAGSLTQAPIIDAQARAA
jgi:hypothetical protein